MAYLALTLAFFVGCGQDLPAPAPTSVSPDHGWLGRDAAITITGRHFYPDVSVDALGRGDPDVDTSYRAFLVGDDGQREPLAAVTLKDREHLDAIVPEGLAAGRYDLLVQGPSGVEGALTHAFTVTDTLADRLTVDAEDITFQVREWATAEVSLAGPGGDRVLQDLLVDVTLESEDGETSARFTDAVLFDQEPLDDGRVGIRGRLGADGWANLGFRVDTPDLVTLRVAPVDLGSGIAEAGLKLEFRPGDDRRIEFELPSDPFEVTAGSSFVAFASVVDEFGNPVDDEDVSFTLRDQCQTLTLPVVVRGRRGVELTLTRATGVASCATNALEAVEIPGVSGAFTVLPGAIEHYAVATSPGPFTAGDVGYAFITGSDAYENAVSGLGGRVALSDSVGGVAADAVECNVVGAGAVCTFQPTRADPEVRLRVDGPTGVHGESAPYAVLAGPGAVVDVSVPSGAAVAGTPERVEVVVADAWGNAVDPMLLAALKLVFSDGGPVACAPDAVGGTSGLTFGCTLTRASAASVLEAALPSGVSGVSSPFPVTNGPLSRVEVSPSALSTTAGATLRIGLEGYDAWGNLATVLSDAVVDLSDTGGEVDTTATLAGGNGSVNVVLTQAGVTTVTASQSGAPLGSSAPIAVDAGAAATLDVDVVEPWVWIGVPANVAVTAIDAYGNAAALDTTFTAESSEGVTVTGSLTEGRGTTSLTFEAYDSGATIDATTAGGVTGTSAAFLVVDACADGPTAGLAFAGYRTGVACLVTGTDAASVTASATTSSVGASDLMSYAMAVGDGDATVDTSATQTLSLAAGRHDVALLVVDVAGCGAATTSDVWVGADDGGAVGPISVTSADIDLGDAATVEVAGATTCTRDPADSAVVRVRTDRGAIDGGSGTGVGVGITLGSDGEAAFDVDTRTSDDGGTATIVVEAFDGEARGEVSIEVSGDDRRPVVFAQSPTGYVTGLVDTVTLRFSEPLLESSITTTPFTLTDATGEAIPLDAATLDAAGDEVTLWLSTPVDAADGPFSVNASTAVRDEAGNRLDGAWSGAASAYAGSFGGTGVGPAAVSACSSSASALRPDGDDGSGVEAEAVTLTASASATPTWWIRTVSRRGGTLVRVEPVLASSSAVTWTWDGRDATGRVVDDGMYLLRTDTEDAFGERGGACTVTVDVTNREPR